MIRLKTLLEAKFRKGGHYDTRKTLRVIEMISCEVPGIKLDDAELKRIQQELIVQLLAQLKRAEAQPWPQLSVKNANVVLVAHMFYQQGTTRYPIYVNALKDPDKPKILRGNCYFMVIINDEIYTLINAEHATWFEEASRATRRLHPKVVDVESKQLESALIVIPQQVEQIETKIDPADLDYEVRTDYRIYRPNYPAFFVHKKYGKGKIVATSAGAAGAPDSRGIVNWIEVEFDKPYVSGGKLYKTRKFNNVYTTSYFA